MGQDAIRLQMMAGEAMWLVPGYTGTIRNYILDADNDGQTKRLAMLAHSTTSLFAKDWSPVEVWSGAPTIY